MTCSTIHIACMRWPETIEPICAGTNKRAVVLEAVRLLRIEHGDGPVSRPAAMCSVPITSTDIEIVSVPVVSNIKNHGRDSAQGGQNDR